jgi:hypothetical protein
VVDSGEVGRSAVYSRYNNGPRSTPSLTGESSVYSICMCPIQIKINHSNIEGEYL